MKQINSQSGFSMLDPLIVTLMVGASSLAALDGFQSFEQDAMQQSVQVMAANISSASNTNAAMRGINMNRTVSITKCSDVPSLYVDGLPEGYTVTGPEIPDRARVECDISLSLDGTNYVSAKALIKGTAI